MFGSCLVQEGGTICLGTQYAYVLEHVRGCLPGVQLLGLLLLFSSFCESLLNVFLATALQYHGAFPPNVPAFVISKALNVAYKISIRVYFRNTIYQWLERLALFFPYYIDPPLLMRMWRFC